MIETKAGTNRIKDNCTRPFMPISIAGATSPCSDYPWFFDVLKGRRSRQAKWSRWHESEQIYLHTIYWLRNT